MTVSRPPWAYATAPNATIVSVPAYDMSNRSSCRGPPTGLAPTRRFTMSTLAEPRPSRIRDRSGVPDRWMVTSAGRRGR